MSVHPITLHLPTALYERLRQRAEDTRRSVEDEVLEVVAASVPEESLAPEYSEAVAALETLDSESLLRAARARMPPQEAERLAELNSKAQRAGLTDRETGERDLLLHLFERTNLIRAHAAKLLAERGHPLPPAELGG